MPSFSLSAAVIGALSRPRPRLRRRAHWRTGHEIVALLPLRARSALSTWYPCAPYAMASSSVVTPLQSCMHLSTNSLRGAVLDQPVLSVLCVGPGTASWYVVVMRADGPHGVLRRVHSRTARGHACGACGRARGCLPSCQCAFRFADTLSVSFVPPHRVCFFSLIVLSGDGSRTGA